MTAKQLLSIMALLLAATAAIGAYEPQGRTPEGEPYIADYGDTEITGYYIPNKTSSANWCHPQGCFTSTDQLKEYLANNEEQGPECVDRAGYCCLDQDKRGFFEEVQCQGTGKHGGDLYSYKTIEPTRKASEPIQNINIPGGDKPRPKHTVAVNPNDDSNCYIPYGSKLYIDLPGHPDWSTTYTAEDTGAAFSGDGRGTSGNCKIDVFTGVGDDAKQQANDLTNKGADVYIKTWEDPSTDPKTSSSSNSHATGSLRAAYQHSASFKPPQTVFSLAEAVITNTESCSQQPYTDRANCVQQELNNLNQKKNDYNVSTSCSSTRSPDAKLPVAYSHEVSGTVTSVGEKTVLPSKGTQRATRDVTIEEQGQPTTVELEDTVDSDSLDNIRVGDYITLKSDTACSSTQGSQIIPSQIGKRCGPYNLDTRGADLQVTKETEQRQALKQFLLRAADCSTAASVCVCNISHPQKQAYYADGYADYGQYVSRAGLPYNFKISNGSTIDTELDQLSDTQLQTLIDNPTGFKAQLRQDVKDLDYQESFRSPSTDDVYLLHSDDRLAFLDKKPEWYATNKNKDALVPDYNSVLQNKLSTQNIISLLSIATGGGASISAKIGEKLTEKMTESKSKQPRIPSCNPQTYYQTVCVQHNPSTSTPVNDTRQQAMSIPPLEFTVAI